MIDFSNLPVEKIFRFDIEQQASRLESKIGDKLLPAPVGIYIKHEVDPVWVDGMKCYTHHDGVLTLVTDITQYYSAIIDEEGETVIPKVYMEDKQKYISNTPFLPYRSIKILELLIKQAVYVNLEWLDDNEQVTETSIRSHLVEMSDEEYEKLLKICHVIISDIVNSIDDLIGTDVWHIFFVDVEGSLVTIKKNQDFRIYEWEQWRLEKHGSLQQPA